ncbi:Zinc finger and SCAN domain-containing protein 32, partial [Saguinus oedipus]
MLVFLSEEVGLCTVCGKSNEQEVKVSDSEKDLKGLMEEMAPLGATRESLRYHWKQEDQPEEPTLKGSQSSHQRPGEQSEGKQKPLFSPET